MVINALCIHSGKELKDSISCLDPLRVTGLNLDVWADWLALPPRPSPARCENELALRNEVDGYRALAFKAGVEVRLLSRNRTLFNENYPELIGSLKLLRAKDFIIHGEIAALDQNGKSSFQLLQSYGKRKQIPLVYYAFVLLNLEGTGSARSFHGALGI